MPLRGAPKIVLNPTLKEIFELCIGLRLTFADLISCVLHKDNPNYQLLKNENIMYQQKEYNLISDEYNSESGIYGLSDLNKVGQVKWNDEKIIQYLNQNSQIKYIYFTRQLKGEWKNRCENIRRNCRTDTYFANIYSPSGRRLRKPVMDNLLKKWKYGDLSSKAIKNYGKFDEGWLLKNGVKAV